MNAHTLLPGVGIPLLQAGYTLAAGVGGGAVNTIAGGGSLLTYPALVAFGYPPVVADITNAAGIIPGSAQGAWSYRSALPAQRGPVLALAGTALAGAVCGAVLLLILPSASFTRVVPWLIGFAVVLVLAGTWKQPPGQHAADRDRRPPWGYPLMFAAGLYGGYFSACQGVILIGVIGAAWPALGTQQVNALKNLAATGVLVSAVTLFSMMAHPAWGAAALLAIGSVAGGVLGARVGKRLSPWMIRGLAAGMGIAAITHVLT